MSTQPDSYDQALTDLQLLRARNDKPDNEYNEKIDINHGSIGTFWNGLQMLCDVLIRWLLVDGARGRVTRKAKTFSNRLSFQYVQLLYYRKECIVQFPNREGLRALTLYSIWLFEWKFPATPEVSISTDALFVGQTSGFFPDKQSLYVHFRISEYESFYYDGRIKTCSIRRKTSSPRAFLHNLGCLYSIQSGSLIPLSWVPAAERTSSWFTFIWFITQIRYSKLGMNASHPC